MGYLLIFTREDGQTTNKSLSFNITEVSLSSQDGLEDNHRYFIPSLLLTMLEQLQRLITQGQDSLVRFITIYKASKSNRAPRMRVIEPKFLILHPSSPKSVNNLLIYFGVLDFLVSVTSDVQAVTATVVGQSINIRCLFIAGSDTTGCTVLLVSNCSTVDDININLTRNGRLASRNLTLSHNT